MSRRPAPFLSGVVLVVALVVGLPAAALAAFVAVGTSSANAAAATFPAPGKPTIQNNASNEVVAWTATALSTGRAVDSYQVKRTVGSTTTIVCTTTNLTCADTNQTSTATYVVVAKVGGWTSTSAPTIFSPDNTAPVSTLTVTPAVNAAGWVLGNNPSFTLSAVDSGSGVQNVSYVLNSGSTVTTNGDAVTFSLSQQGTVAIQYWSTDKAGNVETKRTTTYKIDGVAPMVPASISLSSDSGSSATDLITNVAAQTLSGTTEANATVKVTYGSTTKTTTADSLGKFSVTLTLEEGVKAATIRSTDAAGNESTTVAQLRLDTVDPTVVSETPISGTQYTDTSWSHTCASRGGPGICGTAADTSGSGVVAVTYELRKSGLLGGNYQCWNGSSWSAGQCGRDTDMDRGVSPWWASVPTNSMPNGFILAIQMRLVLTVTDVAGNETVQTVSFSKY
jgi:hypothetical protein